MVVLGASCHSLFLDDEGNVWSCGRVSTWDDHGIYNFSKELQKLEIPHCTLISTFNDHSLCLDSNGDVYSFGDNNFGQLGHGDTKYRSKLTKIEY